MNSNSKLIKRAFSFIMALALVLSMVLVPGVFSATVFAEGAAEPTGTTQVLYVDGKGSGAEDGSSAENALAMVSDAYAKIPTDNVKTTIVICGDVSMRTDTGFVKLFGTNHIFAPTDTYSHAGEVVFTSVYDGINYNAKNTAGLHLPTYYVLLGDTTFENINIRTKAYTLYANYYKLRLGEGVDDQTKNGDRCFAQIVYLGTHLDIYNAILNSDNENVKDVLSKDIEFTMQSGTINELNGCGNGRQGDLNEKQGNPNYKPHNVTLNLEGGKVNTLTVISSGGYLNGNERVTLVENANVNIAGGVVNNLIARKATYAAMISGKFTGILDLQGEDVTMSLTMDASSKGEFFVVDSKVRQVGGVVTGGTFTNNGAGAVSGKPIKDAKTGMYFLAEETDGVYRAYPFNMAISGLGINTMAKNPDDENAVEPAACLRASFMAFDALMDNIDNYGIMINGEKVTAKDNYEFDKNIIEAYADLNGSFRDEKIDKTKTVQAYMTVNGVDYVSTAIEIKPADIVRGISEKVDNLSDYHKELIAALMEKIGA